MNSFIKKIFLLCVFSVFFNTPIVMADLTSDAEIIFDEAETQFPQFFPSNQSSLSSPHYVYRYYPSTEIYMGVNLDNGMVYLLGGQFGDSLYSIGSIEETKTLLGISAKNVDYDIIHETPDLDTSGYDTNYKGKVSGYYNIVDELLINPDAQAGLLKPGVKQQAYLHTEKGLWAAADHDTFALDLDAGTEYQIEITPHIPEYFTVSSSYLYGPSGDNQGAIIAVDEASDGSAISNTFTAQESGEHFLSVYSTWAILFYPTGTDHYDYNIELIEVP